MTNTRLDVLEVKAKAIPENLTIHGDQSVDTGYWVGVPNEANAQFIANSPATILELIEALRQVRKELDWLADDIAISARRNRWHESTYDPAYWLKAAREATK